MLDHAFEQHEDSAEGGEAFGSALHLAPVFPQHDRSGSAYFADFDLPFSKKPAARRLNACMLTLVLKYEVYRMIFGRG